MIIIGVLLFVVERVGNRILVAREADAIINLSTRCSTKAVGHISASVIIVVAIVGKEFGAQWA